MIKTLTKNNQNLFLGINVGHHDSSVCILQKKKDGFSIEILEEERLTKKKKTGFYPYLALQKVQEKYDISELPSENVAFTTFFTTLSESFEFIEKNKTKSKYSFLYNYDSKLTGRNKEAMNVVHHEAHLFSVLPSLDPLEEHLILIADGSGSNFEEFQKYSLFGGDYENFSKRCETISVYLYKGGKITTVGKRFAPVYMVRKLYDLYSPGTYFSACAEKVFGHWSHSGKAMGLAGYHQGDTYSPKELFMRLRHMPDIQERSKDDFDNLSPDELDESQKLCASVQAYYESYMMDLLLKCSSKAGKPENLVFAGGCALNCIFNEKLRKTGLFKNIYVPPQPNDEGVSLGAAVAAYHRKTGELPILVDPKDPFKGEARNYSESEVKEAFKEWKVEKLDLDKVADLIKNEEIIAWARGRSETGPRALGHRSILCAPFIKNIKSYLNENIKFRESFRPYGCSVLEEEQEKYFESAKGLNSPYMSFAPVVKTEWREQLKEITHIDGTLRTQTVTAEFDLFYDLLKTLEKATGTSMVIHTSLNINKQPILESLADAVKFLEMSQIRFMVFEDWLISAK